MTMQNLVLVVQNTADPTQMGVASSGVTFFRSLGGTIGTAFTAFRGAQFTTMSQAGIFAGLGAQPFVDD